MTGRPTLSVTVSGLTRLFGDDLAGVLDVARAADEAGVHQLVMPDHVVMGARTDRYPFGKFPYPPSEPWLEAMTTLAAMAGVTSRVRLGTGVLIAPLRPVTLLAKTVATLDVLSRGRVDLGVGTGWQREEFTEPGMAFAGRGARMDDALRACRALWEQEQPVSFSSPTADFSEVWCLPRPVQPRVPIWFGGGPTDTTLARIAELGDGWLPLGVTLDEIAVFVERLRGAFRERGRDPSALGVRLPLRALANAQGGADLDAMVASASELAAAGITSVSVTLGPSVRSVDDVAPFLADLAAAFAA
ncbi:MAG: LLM class F420-dependent oxidoreductase [Actinobacteria bacterium]|nr:LLM class F420-dependent oxidoreductase [Actinomycetota bacterium]